MPVQRIDLMGILSGRLALGGPGMGCSILLLGGRIRRCRSVLIVF